MEGTFSYVNGTKLYFGTESLDYLDNELNNYGINVVLVYGMGSIKKNGIYDKILKILYGHKKVVYEIANVMSNPTREKLESSIEYLNKTIKGIPHLILSVGGGSVHDFSKALSIGLCEKDNIYDKYWKSGEYKPHPTNAIPVGTISTLFGSGSEMNASTVISDKGLKLETVFDDNVRPKFAILNPEFCLTVSKEQLSYDIFDIIIHITEQYFSTSKPCSSDYLALGLLKSTYDSLVPLYDRDLKLSKLEKIRLLSDLMWNSIYACNSLLSKGKEPDWGLHLIAQNLTGLTNIPHGKTLMRLSNNYYRSIFEHTKSINLKNKYDMFKREFKLPIDKFLENVKYYLGYNDNSKLDDNIIKELVDITYKMKFGNISKYNKKQIKEIIL